MNYQALKFIEVCLNGLLKDAEKNCGKEFIAAVKEMLTATKKLMKFF